MQRENVQKEQREKIKQKMELANKEFKDNDGTEYPIEHSYIDLNWLVIGEKIRAVNDPQALKNMFFD